jgi:hypothetical protein
MPFSMTGAPSFWVSEALLPYPKTLERAEVMELRAPGAEGKSAFSSSTLRFLKDAVGATAISASLRDRFRLPEVASRSIVRSMARKNTQILYSLDSYAFIKSTDGASRY